MYSVTPAVKDPAAINKDEVASSFAAALLVPKQVCLSGQPPQAGTRLTLIQVYYTLAASP